MFRQEPSEKVSVGAGPSPYEQGAGTLALSEPRLDRRRKCFSARSPLCRLIANRKVEAPPMGSF